MLDTLENLYIKILYKHQAWRLGLCTYTNRAKSFYVDPYLSILKLVRGIYDGPHAET